MRTFKDYTNFTPEKFQACLVRDMIIDEWEIAVCAGRNNEEQPVFFDNHGMYTYLWMQYLPLNNITLLLAGTTKSYIELVEDLEGIIEPGMK